MIVAVIVDIIVFVPKQAISEKQSAARLHAVYFVSVIIEEQRGFEVISVNNRRKHAETVRVRRKRGVVGKRVIVVFYAVIPLSVRLVSFVYLFHNRIVLVVSHGVKRVARN